MKRAFVIVLDGCGVGELPDAATYNDEGSNTLANIALTVGGMELPHMERMGLGKIGPIQGLKPDIPATAAFGKMAEVSPGKDSTTGHWELAGLILDRPFPVYPHGFPEEVTGEFRRRTGLEVLGNKPASGTEIIRELGEEHIRSGKPIVYTSADSVFQIAAHESVFSLKELYYLCETARNMLQGGHAVARVIARPFCGNGPDDFERTQYRKDYSLKPTGTINLEILQKFQVPTCGIGKIYDLYGGKGLDSHVETKSNREGMEAILRVAAGQKNGLIMANLVDFDMLWGHRNKPRGFYAGLREFDQWLPELWSVMTPDDILFITADHGNDPTTPGTDHSREYVPVLAYGAEITADSSIGTRGSFADLQATLAELYGIPSTGAGKSFARAIIQT